MKTSLFVLLAVALCVVALPLQAQTGCENSPENPTLVLGLVGTAGACAASLRARLRARKK